MFVEFIYPHLAQLVERMAVENVWRGYNAKDEKYSAVTMG